MSRLLRVGTWIAASCTALHGDNSQLSTSRRAKLMTTENIPAEMPAESRATVEPEERRIVVVGKTGNGKSSVCNTLLGRDVFPTGRSMASTTLQMQHSYAPRQGLQLKVVDTPDVTNLEDGRTSWDSEVAQWKAAVSPEASAVLLAVRCDVRYTPEEFSIYQQIRRCWGPRSLSRRLVVAFTFGDRQDRSLEEELKTVCPELQSVLRDARHRYVLFNNQASTSSREAQVAKVLDLVNQMELAGDREAPPELEGIQKGLAGAAAILGLLFAAFITADLPAGAIASGVLCATCTVGLVVTEIYKRQWDAGD